MTQEKFDSRYQSKLFNFLHQQSRRWGEGFQRTFRQIKVATNWSLQAVFYPIYLLIHKAVETAGKQLHPQNSPQQQSLPSADTPIQQVLQTVENLQLTSKPQIQGIAAQLSNHNLVIVNTSNDILDIFTPKQQQLLEECIVSEVANYWQKIQVKEKTETLPEIYRLLNKLTNPKPEPAFEEDSPPSKSIVLIDTALAFIESKALKPISRLGQKLPNTADIQQLIWAAVNYFFANPKTATISSSSHYSKYALPNIEIEEDPWLTTQDLFGFTLPGRRTPNLTLIKTNLQSQKVTNRRQNIKNSLAVGLSVKPKIKIYSHRKTRSGKITLQKITSLIISRQNQQTSQVEAQPDWIEAKAEFIGYQKHPLEQILEWFDQLIVFLEQTIAKVIQFFRKWLDKGVRR